MPLILLACWFVARCEKKQQEDATQAAILQTVTALQK